MCSLSVFFFSPPFHVWLPSSLSPRSSSIPLFPCFFFFFSSRTNGCRWSHATHYKNMQLKKELVSTTWLFAKVFNAKSNTKTHFFIIKYIIYNSNSIIITSHSNNIKIGFCSHRTRPNVTAKLVLLYLPHLTHLPTMNTLLKFFLHQLLPAGVITADHLLPPHFILYHQQPPCPPLLIQVFFLFLPAEPFHLPTDLHHFILTSPNHLNHTSFLFSSQICSSDMLIFYQCQVWPQHLKLGQCLPVFTTFCRTS